MQLKRLALALAATAVFGKPAFAQDTLKMVMGQINNWENQSPSLGQEPGIYKKHNLVIEMTGSQGAGETIQAVISGSADLGGGGKRERKALKLHEILPGFLPASDGGPSVHSTRTGRSSKPSARRRAALRHAAGLLQAHRPVFPRPRLTGGLGVDRGALLDFTGR